MQWLLLLSFAASSVLAANWPEFRGPNGSGIAEDSDMPIHFAPTSNVLWKTQLPSGHSSPVIRGGKIFLTAFENNELQTLCLDRRDGTVLWKKSVAAEKIERSAKQSSPAASTPCTDGTNLFVYFGSFGAVAYDFGGKEFWRRPLPVPITQHGASSSPVFVNDLVILQHDADVDSHLLALRKKDGKVAWRTDRTDVRRNFSTPLVLSPSSLNSQPSTLNPLLIVPGTLRIAAYDSVTGHELWTVRGLPNEMCSSPVFGDGLIFVSGWTPGAGVSQMPTFDSLLERGDVNHDGKLTREEAPAGPAKQHFLYIDANKDGFITREEWNPLAEIFSKSQNALLAIRPGGSGEVTATHIAWKQTRGLPYVPSPLCYQHRVYLVKNGGLMSCFNATNGTALVQEERIGALGDYFSSPVAAGGKICVISQQGIATILAAGGELRVLGRNELRSSVLATPAIADDTLYIRTADALFAFHQTEPAAH